MISTWTPCIFSPLKVTDHTEADSFAYRYPESSKRRTMRAAVLAWVEFCCALTVELLSNNTAAMARRFMVPPNSGTDCFSDCNLSEGRSFGSPSVSFRLSIKFPCCASPALGNTRYVPDNCLPSRSFELNIGRRASHIKLDVRAFDKARQGAISIQRFLNDHASRDNSFILLHGNSKHRVRPAVRLCTVRHK